MNTALESKTPRFNSQSCLLLISDCSGLNASVPPPHHSYVETLTPNVIVFRGWGIWELVRSCVISVLINGAQESSLTLFLQCEDTLRSMKAAAGQGSLPIMSLSCTLILDLQPPDCEKSVSVVYKLPCLRCSSHIIFSQQPKWSEMLGKLMNFVSLSSYLSVKVRED